MFFPPLFRAQLAAKDIPAAFKYHRAKKLQREQWGKFLEQELAEKRKSVMATVFCCSSFSFSGRITPTYVA